MTFIFSLADYEGYYESKEKINIVAITPKFYSYMQISELHDLLQKKFKSLRLVTDRCLEIYGEKTENVRQCILAIEDTKYNCISALRSGEIQNEKQPLLVSRKSKLIGHLALHEWNGYCTWKGITFNSPHAEIIEAEQKCIAQFELELTQGQLDAVNRFAHSCHAKLLNFWLILNRTRLNFPRTNNWDCRCISCSSSPSLGHHIQHPVLFFGN